MGDGGPGLAQLLHGGDQPLQTGHRDAGEEGAEREGGDVVVAGADAQPDRRGEHGHGEQRPQRVPRRDDDRQAHRGVDEQGQERGAEHRRGGGRQPDHRRDDHHAGPWPHPRLRAEDHQQDVGAHEPDQAAPPEHLPGRAVVPAQQVARRVRQVEHPQHHPGDLHQQLSPALHRGAGDVHEGRARHAHLRRFVGAVGLACATHVDHDVIMPGGCRGGTGPPRRRRTPRGRRPDRRPRRCPGSARAG